jgi:secondary thiamine-phosphate synthase enzyme
MVRGETFTVQTGERIELTDVTEHILALVRGSGVREGIVSLWSMHTTCAVFMNESQKALHADIKRLLELMVDRDAGWMHNDPDHSDCDRSNADAHLRAMLLGHSLTVQVSGGDVVLGQWQRVLVAELDGPRSRTLRVQIMGLG